MKHLPYTFPRRTFCQQLRQSSGRRAPLRDMSCLDLICEPLRHFVEHSTLSLGTKLAKLPILADRFDYIYQCTFFHLWRPRFTIEMNTFDALIADSPVSVHLCKNGTGLFPSL